MTDLRTGKIYSYSRVPGLLAEGFANWSSGAAELWNAAEASETRRNARVARELRPALPAELPLDDQRRLVHGFSCWLKDEFGVAVHYVIHAPTFHGKKKSRQYWNDRNNRRRHDSLLEVFDRLCCTNDVMVVVPLSPDRLILRLP